MDALRRVPVTPDAVGPAAALRPLSYYGNTEAVKTAVSLPDSLFRKVDKAAAELGVARSRLFAMALEEFLRNRQQEDVTERLNEVYRDLRDAPAPGALDAGLESWRELTKHDSW